jgi:hypothetical protein
MAKRLAFWLDVPVAVAALIGLSLLADRVDAEGAAGDVFTAAITVLVFLMPAASLLGQYLESATRTATLLIDRAADDTKRKTRAEASSSAIGRLLDVARPLRRAIVYTTMAVVVSAAAAFDPPGHVSHVTTPEALIVVSVSLLIGTAVSILPATWVILDYRQTKEYRDEYLVAEVQALEADQAAVTQSGAVTKSSTVPPTHPPAVPDDSGRERPGSEPAPKGPTT